MDELISIIIPVYNLEKYIGGNINNMLSQTYKNIEVIYVDDGSSDSSAQIIKDAALKDSRIKYFYKQNGGVSSARNLGLEKAAGDYIMFVDGDDLINESAAEIYYNSIRQYGTDIAFSDMTETNDVNCVPASSENCGGGRIGIENILEKKYLIIGYSVCGKLFKSPLVKKFRFDTGYKIGEDTIFMSRVLREMPEMSFVDVPLYYYYQRQDSAMHSEFDKSGNFVVSTIQTIVSELDGGCSEYIYAYYLMRLYHFICYERTLIYGSESRRGIIKNYKSIGRQYLGRLLNCRVLGKKRFVYAAFFLSRPLYEKYRLMKDPTMKDFYKQRKQNNN